MSGPREYSLRIYKAGVTAACWDIGWAAWPYSCYRAAAVWGWRLTWGGGVCRASKVFSREELLSHAWTETRSKEGQRGFGRTGLGEESEATKKSREEAACLPGRLARRPPSSSPHRCWSSRSHRDCGSSPLAWTTPGNKRGRCVK